MWMSIADILDGDVEQVMVAAREFVPERLNSDAQTWVNLEAWSTPTAMASRSPHQPG